MYRRTGWHTNSYELEHSDLKESYIHIFTDCQHDIITEFENEIPTSTIDIVTRN